MKKCTLKFIVAAIVLGLSLNLCGCTALRKKFTRKRKKEPRKPVYYQVKKYDVKPSMKLYEKHYVFWVNWHRKLLDELGKNFKSDVRCIQEIIGNLEDMAALLIDEKAAHLEPRIAELRKVRVIIDKRNMTKANETRIRRILEREHRAIKREFSPPEIVGCIRKEFKRE